MAYGSQILLQLAEFPQWSLLGRRINVRQHYKYDCGAACLASIAAYYGISSSLAQIRMECGCTPEGISIQGIMDGAAHLGLKARGLLSKDKEISGLLGIGDPFIAHIKEEGGYLHYVAVYAINGKHLKVMDPAEGKIAKVPLGEFLHKWTGYIIALAPDLGIGETDTAEEETGLLSRLLKGNAWELLLAFLATAICIGASISATFILQQIIDNIVPEGNMPVMYGVCIAMPLLMLLSLHMGYKAARHIIRCSIKMESLLVSSYIGKIFSLPLRFFENYTPGDISSRRDDIELIRNFVTGNIIGMAASILTVAGSLGTMLLYNTRLASIVAASIPVFWLLYRISYKLNSRYGKGVALANSSFESALLEGISSSASLRHYNAMELATDKIGKAHLTLMEKIQHSAAKANLLQTMVQGTSNMLICIVLIYGSFAVMEGEMTLGELAGFYSLCSFFTVPVNDLIEGSNSLAKAKVACRRISEILSLKGEKEEDKIPLTPPEGDIQIKGIHFRHPGRAPLFSGFSATIKRGCINIVQGESGCGKSTLMHLIMGDYLPDKGEICCAGINVRQLAPRQWREMIGYVEQRPQLLNSTILENITLADEKPDIGRVTDICRSLNMERILMEFPQGLLTRIGSNGEGLSGGECQKICIARAMYRNPPIFVFDEATSALDRQSGEFVAGCIRRLRDGGKTIIYISHKRETGIIADNVVSIK